MNFGRQLQVGCHRGAQYQLHSADPTGGSNHLDTPPRRCYLLLWVLYPTLEEIIRINPKELAP